MQIKYKYKDYYKKNKFKYILQYYRYHINTGDIIAGIIKYKETDGFLVDIGDKIASYLPMKEIQLSNKNTKSLLDSLRYIIRDFFLITYNYKNKKSISSIKRLEYIIGWKRIKQMYLEDIIFNQKVQYINKGGIITYIEGLQGFIPNSHISLLKPKKINLYDFILCKLLIINESTNKIILSHKSLIIKLSKHKFRIGEIIYGIIIDIQNYGIFININGILGLLHISEISSYYIDNIYQIFNINDLIKVKIIHINQKQGRLSVSTKNIL